MATVCFKKYEYSSTHSTLKLKVYVTQLGVHFDLAVELFFLGDAGVELGRCQLLGRQERKVIALLAQ